MQTTEIERKYVLRQLPELPAGVEVLKIEQGYLDPGEEGSGVSAADPFATGRLRRIRREDGSEAFWHTVKQGSGLVRQETERQLDAGTFAAHWPRTRGARLRKTRYQLRIGEVVWAIDDFDDLDLVLAEVELPSADTAAPFPSWLEGVVVREVTDDPLYRNFALAKKGLH